MTIIDTIQTTAASGQPLNLAHLDVLHATSPIAEVALQERGTLASLLIGDQHLTLTLDEVVISLTEVTSVLPSRAALAAMIGAAVEINQVGHASYLVRSQIDARQVVRVTPPSAHAHLAQSRRPC